MKNERKKVIKISERIFSKQFTLKTEAYLVQEIYKFLKTLILLLESNVIRSMLLLQTTEVSTIECVVCVY